MNNEIWLDVMVYEGYYKVSSLGRIMSVARIAPGGKILKETILKPQNNGNGYFYIAMCKPGVNKHMYVHRMVSIAFLENPLNKPHVNHIDCDKSNNKLSNLEWVTVSENMNHSIKLGRKEMSKTHIYKFKSAGVKALSKPVRHIETGRVFNSLLDAANFLKIHRITFQRNMRSGKEKRFELVLKK